MWCSWPAFHLVDNLQKRSLPLFFIRTVKRKNTLSSKWMDRQVAIQAKCYILFFSSSIIRFPYTVSFHTPFLALSLTKTHTYRKLVSSPTFTSPVAHSWLIKKLLFAIFSHPSDTTEREMSYIFKVHVSKPWSLGWRFKDGAP